MRFHVILASLILIGATTLVVAPGAAACTPSPMCVVEGGINTVNNCRAHIADCAFWAASLPGTIVNAYLAYVHGVYCDEVGIGC